MAIALVRHSVSDYAKWKTVYDHEKPMVKSKGGKRQILYRNSDSPNELLIITELGDISQAKSLVQSVELKQAMQNGGVIGAPSVTFLEEVEDSTL